MAARMKKNSTYSAENGTIPPTNTLIGERLYQGIDGISWIKSDVAVGKDSFSVLEATVAPAQTMGMETQL